jgi:hypothetical protein
MPALKEKPTVEAVLRMTSACDDARGWAVHYGADYAKAWAECERGDWMIWILVRLQQPKQGSKEHRKLAGCLADIAAEVLPIFEKKYPNDKRVRECIETLRRYAKGKATIKEVREARRSAYAADAYAYDAYADAAAYADDARSSSLKRSADIVRQHYPKPPSIVKFLKRQEKGE